MRSVGVRGPVRVVLLICFVFITQTLALAALADEHEEVDPEAAAPAEAASPPADDKAAERALEGAQMEADQIEEKRRLMSADSGLEEITVTARKREELLQKTPISIRAFTRQELWDRGIYRIDRIGQSTANLKFDTTTGSGSNSRIYIRGVGQDDARSIVDPGVGVYIDGVYLPRSPGGLLNLVDVQRVEVLRGPQGTLFGKNTAGGLINIHTQKPTEDVEGFGRLRVGNFGLLETRGAINIPINIGPLEDRFFTRFSFATATDNGYTTNLVSESFADGIADLNAELQALPTTPAWGVPTDEQLRRVTANLPQENFGRAGDNKMLGTRVALLGRPIDDIELNFTYDWVQENERTRVGECRIANPFSLGRLVTDNYEFFPETCRMSDQVAKDLDGFNAPQNLTDATTMGTMFRATWDFWDDYQLMFLNSWRDRTTSARGGALDQVATEFLASGPGNQGEHDAWSNELNLTGAHDEIWFLNSLDWVAGFYWFLEEADSIGVGNVLRQFLVPDPTGSRTPPFRPGAPPPPDYQLFDTLTGGIVTSGIAQLNRATFQWWQTESYAGYGQLTARFLEDFELTAGLRYTYEEKERLGSVDGSAYAQYGATDAMGVPQNDNWDQWTPMAQLGYDVNEDIFAYFQYARGWKSGGFNDTVLTEQEAADALASGLSLTFEPETSNTFELGVKTQWFDRKLTANLTGFVNLYQDIQITTLSVDINGILNARIQNAAEALITGFELEGNYLLDDEWLPGPNARVILSGGLGFTHADYSGFTGAQLSPQIQDLIDATGCTSLRYEDCPNGVFDVIAIALALGAPEGQEVDRSDLDFKNTPKWNVNVSAVYVFDAWELGVFTFRTDWYWQSFVWYNTDNTVGQPGYGLLDFRISVQNDRWIDTTIALWMTNALDKRYVDGAIALGEGVGVDVAFYGRPRSFGAEFVVRF